MKLVICEMFHKTCFSPIFKFLIVGHAPFNPKMTKVNLKPHMGHHHGTATPNNQPLTSCQ